MRALIQSVALLIVAAGFGWGTHRWHPRAPALYLVQEPLREDEVALSRVLEEWEGKVIWLDARSETAHEEGHVPGAHLLNEEGFLDQLLGLLEVLQLAERPIVIYCNGERCEASRKIREQLLLQLPLENVWVLKGGWPVWKASGQPIGKGGPSRG